MTEAEIIGHFILRQTEIAAEAKRQTEAAALDCFATLANRAAEVLYLDAARHQVFDTRPLDGEALQERRDDEISAIVDWAAKPPFVELGLSESYIGPIVCLAYRFRLNELAVLAPNARGTA